MRGLLSAGAVIAAAALLSAPAQAASFGTLTFQTPTGVVLSNESIPVWLTLTLDPDSPALITDASGFVTSGVTAEEIAAVTWHDNSSMHFDPDVTEVILNHSFQCSGTFTTVCGDGPPYDFQFNGDPLTHFPSQNLDLEPGDSMSWLFGTFAPTGGNAPAGTYSFYNASFIIELVYQDPDNNYHFGSIAVGQTCPSEQASCAFTRTVLAAPGGGAVPEPATWAMMILGFGAAGATLRRRLRVARA